jgi:hypothetical protein
VYLLDHHKVSASFNAGAQAEVSASETRVLTTHFIVLKLWLWMSNSNIWFKHPPELKLCDLLAVYIG